MKNSLYSKTAIELRNLFLNDEVSAKEIATYYLTRIEKFNPDLGAFLQVLSDKVLEKANYLDKKKQDKKPLGKLAGVVIACKDNIHLQGQITTCGSKFLTNYKAPFDATAIKLIEEEDGLIIGKTNLDEFAMGSSNENSAFFQAHNPWDLELTPGGSSGGSAVAVAARLSPISLGTDTGGSIRQPASLTGTVGFKPTYGRVSRYGLVAFGSSLDQIGPFATNTLDIGLMMEVIGKSCKNDATSFDLPPETYLENLPTSLEGITIGIPYLFLEKMLSEPKAHFKENIKILENLGAKIIDVDLNILKHSISTYYVLATAEAATNLARFDGIRYGVRAKDAKTIEEVYTLSRQQGFGLEVKRRIMLGTYVLSSGHKDQIYMQALKVRKKIHNSFEHAFTQCNLIAMPTTLGTAFPLGALLDPVQLYLQDIFTICANLSGLPAISIPSGFDKNNRPYGIQLIGPQLHDVSVVKHAYAFENATKHTQKIPPLFDKEAIDE